MLFSVPGGKLVTRVVAVVGAQGGVGASTHARNFAWSLASITKMATSLKRNDPAKPHDFAPQ
jgi:hypothetical protein